MTDPDDKFPTLSRRDDSGLVSPCDCKTTIWLFANSSAQLSANPDALDLANSRTPGPETYTHSRSRMAHQSMPQNALNMFRLNQLDSREGEDHHGSNAPRHAARHSIEANPHHGGDGANDHANRPASLQSSYSTNDLPTARDGNFDNAVTPPATPSESFHSGRRSQANGSPEHDHSRVSGPQGQQTTLQANAAPFGPHMGLANAAAPAGLPAFQPHFYEYGLQPYMGNQMQPQGQFQNYPPGGAYGAYPAYPNYRFENPARGAGARRNGDADPAQLARFANFPLQHYRGELYNLCKDQHGCRYLQRKLEEQNPRDVEMIYDEILIHVVDLMTGKLHSFPSLYS